MYDLVEGYDRQRCLKEYIGKCITFIVINSTFAGSLGHNFVGNWFIVLHVQCKKIHNFV